MVKEMSPAAKVISVGFLGGMCIYALRKIKQSRSTAFGTNLRDEFQDYGNSWSYMKLSPEFVMHEKPIAPDRSGADLARGNGGVQSDPYYDINYDMPGYDYYRTGVYPSPPATTSEFAGEFAGPKSDMFSTMLTSTKDKMSNFVKGFGGM